MWSWYLIVCHNSNWQCTGIDCRLIERHILPRIISFRRHWRSWFFCAPLFILLCIYVTKSYLQMCFEFHVRSETIIVMADLIERHIHFICAECKMMSTSNRRVHVARSYSVWLFTISWFLSDNHFSSLWSADTGTHYQLIHLFQGFMTCHQKLRPPPLNDTFFCTSQIPFSMLLRMIITRWANVIKTRVQFENIFHPHINPCDRSWHLRFSLHTTSHRFSYDGTNLSILWFPLDEIFVKHQ